MSLNRLPDTLHGLLRTAIDDARGLNRRKYKPHYSEWHCPDDDGRCEVCLAGSILAGTLQCSPKKNYAPWELPDKTQHKLEALEATRNGAWLDAYRLVHQRRPPIEIEARLLSLPAPSWAAFDDWRSFNRHLKSLESFLPNCVRSSPTTTPTPSKDDTHEPQPTSRHSPRFAFAGDR